MEKTAVDAYAILEKVRVQQPVVHHLTNWVTIYDCAQVVKVMKGSPVMAHAKEEVRDMVSIASSLVLNIGTLTSDFIESMKIAARAANKKRIPVILDVCGAGATPFRDRKTNELLRAAHIDIIKGNASEIVRVSGADVRTKGVDASYAGTDTIGHASRLAVFFGCVAVVTGKEDIVTDGRKTYVVANGHEMMTHVVGTGCMAASVVGAFAAVEKDLLLAATAGLVCYEVAAERAAREARGPAQFKERLFDELYGLDRRAVDEAQQVSA